MPLNSRSATALPTVVDAVTVVLIEPPRSPLTRLRCPERGNNSHLGAALRCSWKRVVTTHRLRIREWSHQRRLGAIRLRICASLAERAAGWQIEERRRHARN